MTAKQATAIPTAAVPIDWLRIINAIGIAICGIITAWGAIRTTRVESKVDANSVVTQQIKHQTDGTLTAAKKAIAISAQNLATATKKPEDAKLATEAWDAYESQVRNQEKAEEISKK